MGELVKGNHVPVRYGRPNHHTAYDDPPRVQHKLPKGNAQVIKEFHNEWVDGEYEATQKRSVIEADFTMGKGKSLFAFLGKTSPRLEKKLEPIPKIVKNICLQGTLLLEGMKTTGRDRHFMVWREDEGTEDGLEVAISVLVPFAPTPEDDPLS